MNGISKRRKTSENSRLIGRYHQKGVGSNPTHGIPLISVYDQSIPLSLGLG